MEMSFEAIIPFIRYCHRFEITQGMPFVNVIAYDYRLMYIVSGEGTIEVGGTSYEAIRGCLFFWQPGLLYSLLPDKDKPFIIKVSLFLLALNTSKPPSSAFCRFVNIIICYSL